MRHKQQDSLGESLREEARRTMPAFSQSLHREVMRRLAATTCEAPRPGGRWRVAAAAAVLLAAAAVLLWRPAAEAPRQARSLSLPGATQVVGSLSRPLQEVTVEMAADSLRSIPEDARAMGRYFLRQFPVESLRGAVN